MADDDTPDDPSNEAPGDTVVPFRRPAKGHARRARKRHHQGPKRQFQHHDRVVRLHVRGLVQSDAFIRWLVEEATRLRLDGWARSAADGTMDMLIAGEDGDVGQMLEYLRDGPRPVDMLLADEVPLKGDEPMWQGFHHLSPAGT